MEQTIGKASLRDATIATGVATDKVVALTGQTPAVAVQVVLPTPEERAAERKIDKQLDEITRQIAAQSREDAA
jgi:hypothetical protein